MFITAQYAPEIKSDELCLFLRICGWESSATCPLSAEEIHPQIRNFRLGFKIHARSTTIREH